MIWKTPDQKPEENKQIIFYAGGGHYAYMGFYYKKVDMFGAWNASETQKWTYYDDLIAQADKAELLQEQLEAATDSESCQITYTADGRTKVYYGQNGTQIETNLPLPVGFVITIKENQ